MDAELTVIRKLVSQRADTDSQKLRSPGLVVPGGLERLEDQLVVVCGGEVDRGVAIDDVPLETTVSIGIAGGPANTELEVLMASADTALYQAKRTGRNRVCVAPEPLAVTG